MKVLASQKQLENKSKAAQQASDEWWSFSSQPCSIIYAVLQSFALIRRSVFLDGFIIVLHLMIGTEEHSWLFQKAMRTLHEKHLSAERLMP